MRSISALAATCALAAAATVMIWRTRHPLPEGVAGGAAAVIQGKLLYAGGTTWRRDEKIWLSAVHVYDPAADQWSNGPELPEALAYGPSVMSDAGLEILGGFNAQGHSHNSWRFSAMQWQKSGTVPFPTALGSGAQVKNRIYVFGGCPDVASLAGCTNHVMMRDAGGSWRQQGTLPTGPLALAGCAVLHDEVYLFGGCQPTGSAGLRNVDQAWRYTASTGTWRALRPLPKAMRGMSAIALEGNRILLAGGYHATAQEAQQQGPQYGFSASAWLYDPDRDTYEQVTALPQGAAGIALAKAGAEIFGVGGEDRQRGRSASLIQAHIPQVTP